MEKLVTWCLTKRDSKSRFNKTVKTVKPSLVEPYS